MMMVFGNQRRIEEEDEEVGSSTYREKEGEEEEDKQEGDGKKTKEDQTLLWKYVTRLGGGKRGGTTKIYMPQLSQNLHRFIYPSEKTSMWYYAM